MALDDVCSPMLVKEVRQALRGRSFALGFTVALALASLLTAVTLLDSRDRPSAQVLVPTYLVLLIGLLVYVPFHAYQAMRQEDAEGARDLLALSPLGPWRIVIGKLAATLVVAGLLLSAFLPFMVFIALQPEVDTAGVLLQLVRVTAATVFMAALGVATGAHGIHRVGRGVGMLLLSFVSFGLVATEVRLVEGLLRGASRMEAIGAAAAGWCTFGAITPLLLAAAAASFARDDREQSRGLRIAWLSMAATAAIAAAFVLPSVGADGEGVLGVGVVAILVGTFVAVVLATEGEGLHPEAHRRIARLPSRPLRRAAGLLEHGGGRGLALSIALGLLIGGSTLFALWRGPSLGGAWSAGPAMLRRSASGQELLYAAVVLATAIGVCTAFAAAAGFVMGPRPTARTRRLVRWSASLTFGALSLFLPLLLLVLSQGRFDEDDLVFSPLLTLFDATADIDRRRSVGSGVVLWAVIGVVGLAAAMPRIAAGLSELRRADPARPGRGD